jgi:hypothetical protein
MANRDRTVYALAVLKRREQGAYEISVRWQLGTGEDLPRPTDRFDVQILLSRSRRYLQADGRFGAAGQEHTISVQPRGGGARTRAP